MVEDSIASITSAVRIGGDELISDPTINGKEINVHFKATSPSTIYIVKLNITYTVNCKAKVLLKTASPNVQSVSYNISSNGSFIYIKYRKDSSNNSNYDTLQFKVRPLYEVTVTGLGSSSPTSINFSSDTTDSEFTPWRDVIFNNDSFIKIDRLYRKVVTTADNQITSFSLSNCKIDSTYQIYPCFLDENGNELEYILVGKYMSNSSSTCNSVYTTSPVKQPLATGRTNARARGTGYQIMDWRIQRLWQDLIICVNKSININTGSGVTTDSLGLYWGAYDQWIDGVARNNTTWLYSNTPSTYIDVPTASSSGYSAISGYTVPTTSNSCISKLGYDTNAPFFNYPSAVVSNSSYNTYYCDAFYYSSVSTTKHICNFVGHKYASSGIYGINTTITNTSRQGGVRLCYRPIN